MANTSPMVAFPLKENFSVTNAEVYWATLDKVDQGPPGTSRPNHQISIIVTPDIEAKLNDYKTKANAKSINGFKVKADGTKVITMKSVKFASQGIEKFPNVAPAKNFKGTSVLPIRRGDKVSVLASIGVVRGTGMSLFLQSVAVNHQPDRTETATNEVDFDRIA